MHAMRQIEVQYLLGWRLSAIVSDSMFAWGCNVWTSDVTHFKIGALAANKHQYILIYSTISIIVTTYRIYDIHQYI